MLNLRTDDKDKDKDNDMRFMNEFDLAEAFTRFNPEQTPNRAALAEAVYQLATWANANSDGWAYWPAPARAAAKAMEQIDPTTWADIQRMESEDCTDTEFKAAAAPIKRFLTRQGVPHEVVFG